MEEIMKEMNRMMESGLMTEKDLSKFMNKMTGGTYLTETQKEELQFLVRDYSYKLDEFLELGLFTGGQVQRAKSKLRKACLAKLKNEENTEEE